MHLHHLVERVVSDAETFLYISNTLWLAETCDLDEPSPAAASLVSRLWSHSPLRRCRGRQCSGRQQNVVGPTVLRLRGEPVVWKHDPEDFVIRIVEVAHWPEVAVCVMSEDRQFLKGRDYICSFTVLVMSVNSPFHMHQLNY